MLRSLYSGVSGLRNHQEKMDVIGNNVANVNTVGYKKARTSFKDMLSQTIQGAGGAVAAVGGTNPVQIGLGVSIGSVETIMTQGGAQATGKNTDLMIQGDGFFVLKTETKEVYSRAGSFDLNSEGYLVDLASGATVQAYAFDATQANINVSTVTPGAVKLNKGANAPGSEDVGKLDSFSIDKNGIIYGVFIKDGTSTIRKIAQIEIATFPNTAGLLKEGGNLYSATNNSGLIDRGLPGTLGRGQLLAGALEMSNVDLSEEFTDMVITQRGFQANSRVITVSDSLLEELINLKRG